MSVKNQPNKKRRVGVLLPVPLGGAYDYALPEGVSDIAAGSFVRVPFGRRQMTGVVWKTDLSGEGRVDDEKLKEISEIYPFSPLDAENRRFIDWVASYTMSAAGAVLKMAMSIDDVFSGVGETEGFAKNEGAVPVAGFRMTPAREKLLAAASAVPESAAALARKAGVSANGVQALFKAGLLKKEKMTSETFETPDPAFGGVALNEEQQKASDFLKSKINAGFSVTLLDGVTGSGKTEVYLEAAAKALECGRRVLVLLPEIGLTGQWVERFRRRFGISPALWHSDMGAKKRRETWKAVLDGRIRVLAGARSALFLPFSDLGLIVVDEEHDASYKQEDGVIYHARDMAVVRAKISDIPIVLSSATPSLETVANVNAGRYEKTVLHHRFGAAKLPDVRLIDMRRDPPEDTASLKSFLSPVLLEHIKNTLFRDEQSLLFLNRRGYAPLVLCRKCGYRFQCTHCSAWLVEHREAGRLECHHCGYSVPVPEACPVCGETDSLASCGPGVERISEEIQVRFPQARRLIVTGDMTSSPDRLNKAMRRIRDHEADIIIGTQILAKGHHFPDLTLVGIVDADLGLAGGDLRAGERTYQMLSQVAGRAGRADKKGLVLMQSYEPDNAVISALACGDAQAFIQAETESREAFHMPPFGRMAALVVSGEDRSMTEQAAYSLGKSAPYMQGVRVLGPAPAPLALLRGKYRYRLLLQTERNVRIQNVLSEWLESVKIPSSVRVKVDIDPYSFF